MIIAGILMVAGAFLAFACSFMAALLYGGGYPAHSPWERYFTLYCAGIVASIAVPSITWWLLLPRVRWLGLAALMAFEALLFLVWVYYRTLSPS